MITLEYLKQLAKEQNLEINSKEEFQSKVNWFYISIYQNLSEDFVREFKNKVDWYYISKFQKLSENFIIEFKDEVDWACISINQKLSEEFIIEFQDKINWIYISKFQKLSENFIREFQDKIYWAYISYYQKLSENFIREFQNKVNWNNISLFQKLSEDFIREFKSKVDWEFISRYQSLSEEFRKEFNIKIIPNNWLYKSKEDKLFYIKTNTNYEVINDEYILAYKAVREDNYSVFNFQYQYFPGNIYEAHCDYNIDEDSSFGLSAWTKEGALEYYNRGKLLLVKINIEDIGAIVQNNQKIRCKKLLVLNEC